MTETKPDPKPRSAFLPIMLLVVGLLLVAGVVLVAFVPLKECEWCSGIGIVTLSERSRVSEELYPYAVPNTGRTEDDLAWRCAHCQSVGRMTFYEAWNKSLPEGLRPFYLGHEGFLFIKQLRESPEVYHYSIAPF